MTFSFMCFFFTSSIIYYFSGEEKNVVEAKSLSIENSIWICDIELKAIKIN